MDELIRIGDAVKALGNGKVGGYLVRFSTEHDPDLTGDYFTKSTDFDIDDPRPLTVYYQHGQDPVVKKRKLGKAQVQTDDVGVWIEAQLKLADEYDRAIYQMVEAGKLKWSSGSASHLVERNATGKAAHIKAWPLVEATLTPTPAEPRAAAISIKGAREMEEDENNAQDGRVDALEAQMKQLSEGVNTLLKLAQDSPAIRNTPYISDGGSDASGQVVSHPGQPAKTREIKTFGDFLVSIARGDKKRLGEFYKAIKAPSGLSEGSGTQAGYLVPQQFMTGIYEQAMMFDRIYSRCTLSPMTARGATWYALKQSGTYVEGKSQFLGGMGMTWIGEGDDVPKTMPSYRKIELVNHKAAGYCPVTNELLDDSGPSIEANLVNLFGKAVAFTREHSILRGDGVAKPLGVLNSGATITTATALGTTPPDPSKLLTMWKRLNPACRSRAVWLVNVLLIDLLAGISTSNTPNAVSWMPNLQGNIEMRLFGAPVLETEILPDTFATAGLLLADFSEYVVGDRQGLEIAMSEHVNFLNDETLWRVTMRMDGQPMPDAPVKIGSDAADSLSPFVKSK
jgi:HK97 family phage major capsid protein